MWLGCRGAQKTEGQINFLGFDSRLTQDLAKSMNLHLFVYAGRRIASNSGGFVDEINTPLIILYARLQPR